MPFPHFRAFAALQGLRARILGAVAGILLVFAAAAALLLLIGERSGQRRELESRLSLLALTATDELFEAIQRPGGAGDLLSGEGGLRDLLRIGGQPVEVRIVSRDGTPLALGDLAPVAGAAPPDPHLSRRLADAFRGEADGRPVLLTRFRRDGATVLEAIRVQRHAGIILGAATYAVPESLAAPAPGRTALVVAGVTVVFFLLLGAMLSWITTRAVLQPVQLLSSAAQALGQGFLDARVDRPGSSHEMQVLAGAFGAMARDLKTTVGRLSGLADEVAAASTVILGKGAEVVEGTGAQATAVQRTLGAVERMAEAARATARQVAEVAELSERVGGRFVEMAATSDQIADSTRRLGSFVDRSHDALLDISASVGQVAHSADDLRELSAGAAQAVGAIHASTAAVRQRTAESLERSAAAHEQAAALGSASVDEAVAGIDRLRATVDGAVEVIQALARRTEEVGRVTTLIDDVTDRTRLLGLNAAIMAAQAGEQGRGFAVVAEEIRSLSQQIGGSTRDIERVLTSMRDDATAAVRLVEEGSRGAAEGVRLAEGVRGALHAVVAQAAAGGRMLADIARETEGQAEAAGRLRGMTDRVAAMAVQTAEAASRQRVAATRIVDATDGMRALAEQVARSTGEHAANTHRIAGSLQQVRTGVDTIAGAAARQLAEVEPLRAALDLIREQAAGNAGRAADATAIMHGLAQRADALRAELSRFRFRGAPAPRAQVSGRDDEATDRQTGRRDRDQVAASAAEPAARPS